MKNILVADNNLENSLEFKNFNFVNIFPQKANDGAYRSTYSELLYRGKIQSQLNDELVKVLSPFFENHFSINKNYSIYLIKPVISALTSIYIDRSIRYLHIVKNSQKQNFYMLNIPVFDNFSSLDEIKSLSATSWKFNQSVLQKISSYFKNNNKITISNLKPFEYKNFNFKNLINSPFDLNLKGKIFNRISHSLSNMHSFNSKFNSLGFSGDEYFFGINGFYGPYGIFQKRIKYKWIIENKNNELRDIFSEFLKQNINQNCKNYFSKIFKKFFSNYFTKILSDNFYDFIVTFYPTNYLETLIKNFTNAEALFLKNQFNDLIGSSFSRDEGYLMASVAKKYNAQIFGVQHGGHYGYIEGDTLHAEAEFFMYDKFITWGWKNFEKELPSTVALPMPNPRFSSVKKFKIPKVQKYDGDVLYYSNLVHRFPHISTCGQARIDFIDIIKKNEINLVKAITSNNISLTHKIYNQNIKSFLSAHYKKLELIGGDKYKLIDPNFKGLDKLIYSRYKLILWDQIGTGTLECFVSNIPTIVYWKRIYSKESKFAIHEIKKLEECGVVHKSSRTLISEVQKAKADINRWMEQPFRKKAIQIFLEKFCMTDPKWKFIWKKKLLSVKNKCD